VELPKIYWKLQMNRFLKWLKRGTPQQSIASDADQDIVYADVRPDQITEDENSAESSFTGSVLDQADSSIFGTGRLDIEKSEDAKSESDNEITVGVSTLNLEEELWPDDEAGVDPYNTGTFDTENK
jgi:hypothetical protein